MVGDSASRKAGETREAILPQPPGNGTTPDPRALRLRSVFLVFAGKRAPGEAAYSSVAGALP